MGYDITFHPISEEQMDTWYFSLMDSLAKGDTSRLEAVAEEAGMDPFYINKYRDLMKYAAGTPPSERFETTHGFYMAVVQGFFRKHYYVRGTAVSFMAEEYPMMERYITPWKDILPEGILPPAQQGIVENYSAGVYLSAEQVKELLSDYEGNKEVREAVDDYFMENGAVLLKALRDAAENEAGMLEATDVVEVEPLDLKKTTSYSDLNQCDPEGAFIYQKVARAQISEFMKSKKS